MSRAVMLSVHPKWCEKIASGEKTIEVRKNRPKTETPFKCYIYCTVEMAGYDALWVLDAPTREEYSFMAVSAYLENPKGANKGNGKVIGEFPIYLDVNQVAAVVQLLDNESGGADDAESVD